MNIYEDDVMEIKDDNEGLALYSFKHWLIAMYKRDLKTTQTDEYIEKFVEEIVMKKDGDNFKNEQIQLYWDIYLSGYITSIVNTKHGLLEQFNSNIKNNV